MLLDFLMEGLYLIRIEDIEYRFLCFEYEDEIENNYTTMTLAAGEDKTWIMKNYIGLTLT